MQSRRQLLKTFTTLSLGGLSHSVFASGEDSTINELVDLLHTNASPQAVASDESYWNKVSRYYLKGTDTINLEQGYWGKMALPVEDEYIRLTRKINQEMAWYARKHWSDNFKQVKQTVARALGAEVNEIALTRNATESFVNLITQYKGLQKQDAVLWADVDYPSFQHMMQWLANEHKVEGIALSLPSSGSKQDFIDAYTAAFQQHPNLKLMLLTHTSNQHGLTLPVKEIAALAKSKGIDVICDCAQSWGLVNFKMDDLGVDWAVFNLHKWIGSPVGVGALYMKAGTLERVSPFPGEAGGNESAQNRVHIATSDFAAFLAVPHAIAFHFAIGGENKAERLRYLRSRWVDVANTLPNIEVLGAADVDGSSGMGGFRIKGQVTQPQVSALQQRLENEFGVFTVVRQDLASGCNIRVTPQVFTTLAEIDTFANALINIDKAL
ncbi:aminotransferase class V-fold PLP-dependent enzyme [Alteromonas sp. AMM-1]|uniref:aminotransferase class V-fold PLP-dependent enzyme n=1 Tax=Alteromonas sp. AMM-1 TaxID=3394233 RepID=UPI0039A416C5